MSLIFFQFFYLWILPVDLCLEIMKINMIEIGLRLVLSSVNRQFIIFHITSIQCILGIPAFNYKAVLIETWSFINISTRSGIVLNVVNKLMNILLNHTLFCPFTYIFVIKIFGRQLEILIYLYYWYLILRFMISLQ